MARNPFKPTAGANPPLLVGRDHEIAEFVESIEDGPGAPMRLSIFSGPRGIGKTVMLNAIADRVQEEHQWLVFHETATPGFMTRLAHAFSRHLKSDKGRRGVSGVTLPSILGTGGGGLQFEPHPGELDDFRQAISPLLDTCERNKTGVLITLGKVHADNLAELREFAAAVQHLVREEREFALALASLPAAIDDLLTDRQITFMRRAGRRDLRDVPLDAVRSALLDTITAHGRTITSEALELAAQATGGYPFMIQLVGYHMWRNAEGETITLASASAGVDAARNRLGSLVHAPALRELSDVDRTFLLAMLPDDGDSRTSDIARRMDKGVQYASVYRARLLAAGMIEPASRGAVRFTMPFLREYLMEHAAHQAMGEDSPPAR